MAENQIAYKIVVDTSKAVQEIKDLEKEIARLKNELANTEEGTLGFDTLSSAVEGLEKKYNTLIQSATKAGEIIVNSADDTTEAIKSVNEEVGKTEKGIKDLGDSTKKVDLAAPFKNYSDIGAKVTESLAQTKSVLQSFGTGSNVVYEVAVDTSRAVEELITLEEEITRLRGELSKTKEGTEGFNTLSSAVEGLEKKYNGLIQNAVKSGDVIVKSADESTQAIKSVNQEASKTEKGLKGLGETAKKVDVSTPFKNYVKIGAAVTASFAAAQSVFSTFGADTKKIAEAAAKAQSLLTVAIAAREVAEAVGAATTVTATIVTKLKTAADNTQIGVLKRLYTVLAANPYAIVATAVGLLVTAFIALTNSADEAAEAQKKFQEGIDTDVSKETTNLKLLIATINDTSQSIKTREKAVDDLAKKFPTYFENLKKEDILSGKVVIATNELTAAIVAQAQARALEQRIAERGVKALDLERQLTKATQDRAKAEKELKEAQGVIITGGATAGGFTATGDLRNIQQDEFNAALQEENKIKNQLNDINVANAIDSQKILDLQKQTVALIPIETGETDDNTDAKNENNKATEEQILLAKQLEDALNNQLTTLQDTADIFKKLAEAGGFEVFEPDVLKRIKELRGNIEALIPKDLSDKFRSIGLDITIQNGTFAVKELGNEVETLQDKFGDFVEELRKDLAPKVFTQGVTDFAKTTSELLNQASLQFQKGIISKEALQATEKLLEQYKAINKLVKDLPKGVEAIFTQGKIEDYLDITKKIAIATGEIQYEKVDGQIQKVTASTVVLSNETERLAQFEKQSKDELIKKYTEQFGILEIINDETGESRKKSQENFLAEIAELEKRGKLTEEQARKLKEQVTDQKADFKSLVEEIAQAQLDALSNTAANIIKEENQIRAFLFQIQQERAEALKLQSEAEQQLLLNNLEEVFKITQQQNAIVIDETKSREEQIGSLLKQFSDKKIDLTKLTEEEQFKIVLFYLNKQKEAVDQAQKDRQEQVDKFVTAIQQIQGALNALGQTFNSYFNAQLDVVEKRYKRTQDTIIGDSVRSSELRIEAEKKYNEERTKLEKRAAKTSLRISLAQSIANSAEAIAKTYAVYGGTPVAVGAAALVAAANVAQTIIIANQLANIDNYKRGGKLKMGVGGLVQGPSHANGGVKFQNGGVELEGNEAVINKVSTMNFMGLLSQINQAGGGRPIGDFDDSRIVEAIAKQRNEPIRAYVVESDITSKQTTSRKLQQLASF